MRITQQMVANGMLGNLGSLRTRLNSLQQQVSSGKRFEQVSEDPTAAAEVMRSQSRLQVMDQWNKNLGDARNWVRSTETALTHVSDLLSRAHELAVAGSNGLVPPEGMNSMATEADQLLQDLLVTLNGEHEGGAMFGGYATGSDPFALNMATGAVTYSGDTGVMQRDVGPGVTMGVNLHGGRLADWAASDNPLTAIWQLAEDLRNGSATGVATDLGTLDTAMSGILDLRTELGAREKRLDQVEFRLLDLGVQITAALQQAQGVEMEKAIMELNSAEVTYRAALQVGARVFPQTLVDFLR